MKSQKELEDQVFDLSSLVIFLSKAYIDSKDEYYDKHLHTCSFSNPNRRELTDVENDEIMRFPLIQSIPMNIEVKRASQLDFPDMHISKMRKLLEAICQSRQ